LPIWFHWYDAEQVVDQWNIIGKIGPVIYEKNSYDLRKEKYIADVKVQILKLQYLSEPKYVLYPGEVLEPADRYRREQDFIMNNNFRNDIISKLCNKLKKNTLIMVDYIDHGNILKTHLSRMCPNKRVYFIRGEVPVRDRDEIKQLMEEQDDVIIVAISKIFSTGINIKNLHYIVFAAGGKAKIKIIQSIGRGLRLHKNKQQLVIFDIGDDLRYGSTHLSRRVTFYKKENIEYGSRTIKEKNSQKEESSTKKSSTKKGSPKKGSPKKGSEEEVAQET